jgi:hypothetical protein
LEAINACNNLKETQMRKFLICLIATFSVPLSPAQAKTEWTASIFERCRAEWKGDMRMRDYCEEQQEKARDELRSMRPTDDIESECTSRWGDDYRMLKHCLETTK